MKRFHIHISVEDLNKNITFYSQLFNAEPTVLKQDYAKWALDDPSINFAISNRAGKVGLDHVGIQTDTDEELSNLRHQLETAGIKGIAQNETTCCYTRSDKYWIQDPQGIAWETFHSLESVPVFGETQANVNEGACCVPGLSEASSSCC